MDCLIVGLDWIGLIVSTSRMQASMAMGRTVDLIDLLAGLARSEEHVLAMERTRRLQRVGNHHLGSSSARRRLLRTPERRISASVRELVGQEKRTTTGVYGEATGAISGS